MRAARRRNVTDLKHLRKRVAGWRSSFSLWSRAEPTARLRTIEIGILEDLIERGADADELRLFARHGIFGRQVPGGGHPLM